MNPTAVYQKYRLDTPDGFPVRVHSWKPNSNVEVRGIVQLIHGSSEHAGRYSDVANELAANGFVFVATDHRGHGESRWDDTDLGVAGEGGWSSIVHDIEILAQHLRQEHPPVAHYLLAHSMGTLLALDYLQATYQPPKGVIVCAPAKETPDLPAAISGVQQLIDMEGRDTPAPRFDEAVSAYNAPFEPSKTPWAWFSRDESQVDAFVLDPLCGFPESNGFILEMLEAEQRVRAKENLARLSPELRFLVLAGEADPAIDFGQAAKDFVQCLKSLGLTEVDEHFYAETRHQLLFESNRQAIVADIINWLGRQTTR